MRSHEFINEDKRPSPEFINRQVDTQQWKKLGDGADVSVWAHIADPDTAVKIVGGGRNSHDLGSGSILYAKFCVDNSDLNKHFLKVLDINNDDPMVCQIRVERLLPLPEENSLGDALHSLSDAIEYNLQQHIVVEYAEEVVSRLEADGLARYNDVNEIVDAVKMLVDERYDYARRFRFGVPTIDLHEANWMMRPNGTIVISDPWS